MPRKTAHVIRIPISEHEQAEIDAGHIARDYVLARAAVALAALTRATEDVTEAIVLFQTPAEDRKGKERKEALDSAIESASIATRALEDAMEHIDDADMDADEPWEEQDDDEEGAD